jgi:fumarate hydratase subunit alpha
MKTINVDKVTQNIKEMCIEANHFLASDMDEALKRATQRKAP